MERLVIQIGARHGRTADIIKSNGKDITIGRSFDNDLILTDPYVAAKQIRITPDTDKWLIEVLDQTNPVLLNGQPIKEANKEIKAGDKIKIGRTTLSVFSEDHQVEHTRKLLSSWIHRDSNNLLIPIMALLAVSILDGLLDYLQYSTTHEWEKHVATMVLAAIILLVWAGFWSIIGRLLRHQHHFATQLLITTLICGAVAVIYPLASYVVYNTNSTLLSEMLAYVISFISLAILIRFNLFFATNVKHSTAWGFASSGLLSLAILSMVYFNKSDFDYYPKYSNTLMPPFAKIAGDSPIDEYFKKLEKQIDKIEVKKEES